MIPYFNEEAIGRVLDEKTSFRLALETFQLVAAGKTTMPPKMYLDLPAGDFRAMPAFIGAAGERAACGIKWISVFPQNRQKSLPTVNGTILLNSPRTGMLLAILEANTITAARTGAAAAVAAKFLANPHPAKLTLVGAGLQAAYQLRAHAALYHFSEISVWGYFPGEAEKFCAKMKDKFPMIHPDKDLRVAVRGADIITTCTSSRRPLVYKEWVKPGSHINAIGADAKGKQELDPKLLIASKIVVDEWEQASHSGEINVPFSRKILTRRHVCAELADVVSGRKKVRTTPKDITVFDSTGLAVLDVYFAQHTYRALKGARRG